MGVVSTGGTTTVGSTGEGGAGAGKGAGAGTASITV